MIITYVGLHKFLRFRLGQFETFELRPFRKVQLLLGTNGSGKSSFLEVGTSVMPKDGREFEKGGWWKMECIHHQRNYALSTRVLDHRTEHSFIVDGEELNQGGTVGVQKGLVKEHFNMTQELHDVITGARLFTQMTSNERQYWMTMLSDSDFSYVLQFYDRLKKAQRANLAVLKHTEGRIVEELASQIKPEDIEQMQQRAKELHTELSVLYREYSGHDTQSLLRMERGLNEAAVGIAEQLTQLIRTNLRPTHQVHYKDLEDIEQDLADKRSLASELSGKLQTLSEHYEHYDRQLEKLREAEGLDVASLRDRLAELKQNRETHLNSLKMDFKIGTLHCDQGAGQAVQELISLFSTMQNIQLENFEAEELARVQHEIVNLQERLSGVNGKLGILEGRLQHIAHCETVDCPKCQTSFKPGVGEGETEELRTNFAKGDGLRNQMVQRLSELREKQDALTVLARAVGRLQSFREAHPELSPLFALIDRQGGLVRSYDHLPLCGEYLRELNKHRAVLQLDDAIAPIEGALAKVSENVESGATIRAAHETAQRQIEEVHGKIHELNGLIRELAAHASKIKRFDTAVEQFEQDYLGHQDQVEAYIEAIRQQELGGLIDSNQSSLAVVSEALKTHEVQAGILDDLNKTAQKLKLKNEAYLKIMAEVSPVDGLIAEQIGLYINSVLEAVNQIIASTWEYPMGIKPCDVEGEDLDYKFPLWSGDMSRAVPDIAKGSSGQRSMVNLAFRLAVYHFLNLREWPLYMDEIGKDFDPKHRHNLVRITEELIDDPRYSQVFIISHNLETYGSLVDADVISLDRNEVSSGMAYNENVVIV